MKKIHIGLAVTYGILWVASGIYTWTHLSYILPNRLAAALWTMALSTWPICIYVTYILKVLKKYDIVTKSWYAVILPSMYGVAAAIIIEMNLMNSNLYDANSKYIRISYLAVAVYFGAITPFMWHLLMNRIIREELKQKRSIRN